MSESHHHYQVLGLCVHSALKWAVLPILYSVPHLQVGGSGSHADLESVGNSTQGKSAGERKRGAAFTPPQQLAVSPPESYTPSPTPVPISARMAQGPGGVLCPALYSPQVVVWLLAVTEFDDGFLCSSIAM